MQEVSIGNVSVVEKDGEFFVTSLQVAEHFEKDHHNVLKAIDNLEVSERFRLVNFGESNRKDSQGIRRRLVLMTRDGFTILAMGFTGPKATAWKEQYIEAFNAMERELTRVGGAAWLQKRIDGKLYRRPLTDSIQRFISYAVAQGSETYAKKPFTAYVQFTKMEYRALFLLSKSVPDLRDKLSTMDLNTLAQAEKLVRKCLDDLMDNEIPYKEIYQEAKRRVEQFATWSGVSDQNHLLEPVENNPFAIEDGDGYECK